MSKVSSKRQVTLPVDLCLLVGIEPGDEVSVFVDRKGVISVVKKIVVSSKGFLRGVQKINNISDENSLASIIHDSSR